MIFIKKFRSRSWVLPKPTPKCKDCTYVCSYLFVDNMATKHGAAIQRACIPPHHGLHSMLQHSQTAEQRSTAQHSTAQHSTAQHSVQGRSLDSGSTHLPPAVDDDNGDAHEDAAQHCQGNADGQHCVQGG